MAEVCPLSCGTCTHQCNDTDASCGSWAQQGECEANPDAMLRICPTSCGLCTPECKDLKPECPGWGAAGECNENPEFMIRNCARDRPARPPRATAPRGRPARPPRAPRASLRLLLRRVACPLCQPVASIRQRLGGLAGLARAVATAPPRPLLRLTAWFHPHFSMPPPLLSARAGPVTCEACKSTCKDVQNDCPGWVADGGACLAHVPRSHALLQRRRAPAARGPCTPLHAHAPKPVAAPPVVHRYRSSRGPGIPLFSPPRFRPTPSSPYILILHPHLQSCGLCMQQSATKTRAS